ncbi:MAG: SDR family NAD(P)-dependent oxidoreductase [Chitinophagales bacterium]|nr:SDR family NAD(P)-dependent oxidoreductase [Chitinophagales bacterium]MDW8394221.1 SDR family NAD(P)-dependent oxidoreductase [Chitinophagales bacterium]
MSEHTPSRECGQSQPVAAATAGDFSDELQEVLITGAAGNLGREVLKVFASKGIYTLSAVVRHREQFHRLPEIPHLRKLAVDLTDEYAVAQALEQHYGTHAPHHVLLLAGGFAMGDLNQSNLRVIRQMLALNFESAYHVVRLLLPRMVERGHGRFVFIGSVPGIQPDAARRMIAYALSKGLLVQLAQYINAFAQGTDVGATVLVPHIIDTPDNRRSMPDADFRKWVKPHQLAELMHQLCRGAASHLREPVLRVWPPA